MMQSRDRAQGVTAAIHGKLFKNFTASIYKWQEQTHISVTPQIFLSPCGHLCIHLSVNTAFCYCTYIIA